MYTLGLHTLPSELLDSGMPPRAPGAVAPLIRNERRSPLSGIRLHFANSSICARRVNTVPHCRYIFGRTHEVRGAWPGRPEKQDTNSTIRAMVPPSTLTDDLEPPTTFRIRTRTLFTCTWSLLWHPERASSISAQCRGMYSHGILFSKPKC